MFCVNCAKLEPDDAAFCSRCGAPLKKERPAIKQALQREETEAKPPAPPVEVNPFTAIWVRPRLAARVLDGSAPLVVIAAVFTAVEALFGAVLVTLGTKDVSVTLRSEEFARTILIYFGIGLPFVLLCVLFLWLGGVLLVGGVNLARVLVFQSFAMLPSVALPVLPLIAVIGTRGDPVAVFILRAAVVLASIWSLVILVEGLAEIFDTAIPRAVAICVLGVLGAAGLCLLYGGLIVFREFQSVAVPRGG